MVVTLEELLLGDDRDPPTHLAGREGGKHPSGTAAADPFAALQAESDASDAAVAQAATDAATAVADAAAAEAALPQVVEVSTEQAQLAEAEAAAVESYRQELSFPLNSLLRGTPMNDPYGAERMAHAATLVPLMDAAIARSATQADVTLYRGVAGNFGLLEQPVGSTFLDKGYGSLSAALPTAKTFADKHHGRVAQIRVPKGAHLLDVTKGYRTPGPDEKEHLLPRSTTYTVLQNDAKGLILQVNP
jgi:hypothetical protein